MARIAITTGAERLVHCSPDRTVFVTTIGAGGETVLCKLFVRGSLADAERETAIAQAAAGKGVARYREAGIDRASGLPRILCDYHEGSDLAELVARTGAVPAPQAAALLAPVAHTLARLHALSAESAPLGICHGDVKPGNLLATASTTLLLDFEHARPITAAADEDGPTTGTHGFAAPEAERGAAPSAAVDVYGLGATLRWLLTGGGVTDLPQDAAVDALLAACTAAEPEGRPAAHEAATALEQLARRLDADHEEELLSRLAGGERLEFVSDLPRFTVMRRLAQRQRRVLARLPNLLARPEELPDNPAGQLLALHHAQRVLRWFPRHRPTLQWRAELANAARSLISLTAVTSSELQRAEQFDLAARWLEEALALGHTLLRLPGKHLFRGAADVRAVGLLQRDPLAFLRRLIDRVAEARTELDAATAKIDEAEERLDVAAAEAAIDAMANRYGGSSPTAARRRDQLNRLAFYVDRIASAQPNADRIAQLWDHSALTPLLDLVEGCARSSFRTAATRTPPEPLGLRSLQVTLVNLAEELPHLYVRSGPALEALSQALHHISDLAWVLVGKAQEQLEAVPVPVRPLQITFSRLDTFRILEALVDRPERPRSRLLDAIEAIRLKFEQARAARDRLAQGAEQAMARGHWTTGLFDMERAVAGLSPTDEAERAEVERLQARLAAARRKKEEIDAAVRANVELATRYGLLQDDADSSFQQRLQTLEERRGCLSFIAGNMPRERAALYEGDLREVELQLTLEHAARAENEFDATEEHTERLRLAERTLAQLESSAAATEFREATPGRLQRVMEHWRTLTEHCRREEERLRAEQDRRVRTRRRSFAGAVALVVALIGFGWATSPWLIGEPADAAQKARTLRELEAVSGRLPARALAAGERLVAVVRRAARGTTPFDIRTWHAEFTAAMVDFAPLVDGASAATVRAFAADCWRAALERATALSDAEDRAWLEGAAAALARELRPFGINAPTAGRAQND